jgi:predicted membrane channel-forming protein YqfA (hemolysin III family)
MIDNMNSKRSSVLRYLRIGFLGDILLFITAILLMSLFSITSFPKAYLIAFIFLAGAAVLFLLLFLLYRKVKN